MIFTLLVFLLTLSILVLIHELGHFLVAKRLGIGVEEFGFGLPPRIFGLKRGETIYSLNWLPIGGFVKLLGEEPEEKEPEDKTQKSKLFFRRPKWQRSLVIISGVLMNFLLAVVVISAVFTQGVMIPSGRVRIEEITQGSPADLAGLQKGDIILAIDDQKMPKSEELIKYTKERLGQRVKLEVQRNQEKFTVFLVPRKEYPQGEGPMGVAISHFAEKKYPLYQAPFLGTWEALKLSGAIFQGLGRMLWQWISQGITPREIAGPVGIAQVTAQVVKFGPWALWQLLGLLSLNLAVVNILPIPALDGGRLLFIGIEALTGKRLRVRVEKIANQMGMFILFALIILVTYNDILRILKTTTIGARIRELFP